MELDDLKGAWKQQTQPKANTLVSDEELFAILNKKATNAIDLLKRSVRFELWFTVIFIVVCLTAGLTTSDETLRNISFITGIISCGFGFYYYKKLSFLNNLHVENISIKENITTLIIKFEKFLFFYRWGYNILVPIALIGGAFLGLLSSGDKDLIQLVSEPKLWLILIAALTPLCILFNFGMKWYLRKLYGNHLSRLSSILLELND